MKKLFAFLMMSCAALTMSAQGVKPLPSLHVEGKWLVDTHGNHVVLHGVMDTPSAWFNNGRWGWNYDDAGRQRCLDYFEKLYNGLEQAHCNVFRLHLEPAWTNDNNYKYAIAEGQPSSATGEADISHFNPTRLKTYLGNLYFPLMQKAMKHGMYVVVRPPGVCPGTIKVGDYYQKYLLNVWDIFTQNDSIRKYAGQISIELANEPVSVKNSQGADDKKALHDFFQPVVDKIRANGFTGVIWVPGAGWQASYADYKSYPITGYNIGYAVHDYDGWYGCEDKKNSANSVASATQKKITQFHNQVPVVDTNPVIITEIDWSPYKPGTDHVNEHGETVQSNYGTWATGRTSVWGTITKNVYDHYGNISMTLSGTACLLDIDKLLSTGKAQPAFDGLEEACGKACMDWYAEYYNVNYPKADFSSVPTSDFGKNYQNPIVRADFPDPDVIRVGSTYYMVSTTMYNMPGATILKSQDLVNWEYCAHPLKQLSAKSGYNLFNNTNAYASGMWACSMKYHNGKFYILINEKLPTDGWELQGWLLTATNPEGEWTAKKLSRSYYDPGMLFDNGKVYVAQGIGNISVCELDENFNFKKEKTVISNKDGLEGSHFYKRGDYYYIYATYGGWPSGQAVFRSTSPFGPYEEKMVVEKYYNNVPNTIHQGALVEDTSGKWWTVMQEDLGALGRMPNLQPVAWTADGWLVVGSNGKPYKSFESKIPKPKTSADNRVKRLPTTDAFRDNPIGIQWEWNHKPDDTAWSLTERPGWLRLKAASLTQKLPQARNMLTQRIFADKEKESTGTIRLDVSQLTEGDRAGICILQDPYAMIAVEIKDGKPQLIWEQDKVKDAGNDFTPSSKTQAVELTDNIVYLRAAIKYGENKAHFYYSTDNTTWKSLGGKTSMSFNLSVFVGTRFGLFCYGTKAKGGIADFDWFTTESDFTEADIYPADFVTPDDNALTVTKITVPAQKKTLEAMIGDKQVPVVTATFADGHTEDVTPKCDFVAEDGGIVEFVDNGQMLGIGQGSTTVNVSYTDPLGNKQETTFIGKSSYFPTSYEYVRDNIAGTGSYKQNASNSVFKFTTTDCQMGWAYDTPIDLSDYKYLIIKLTQKQTADAQVNIYTGTNLRGACYSSPKFGSSQEIVLDLESATYTSTASKDKPLDRSKIRYVTFSGSIANKQMILGSMFVTNDTQYDPTGIGEVSSEGFDMGNRSMSVPVYSLDGRLVRRATSRANATQGLPSGIYIVGNKRIVVRR